MALLYKPHHVIRLKIFTKSLRYHMKKKKLKKKSEFLLNDVASPPDLQHQVV